MRGTYTEQLFKMAFLLFGLLACAWVFVWMWWSNFRKLKKKFNYRITDIWAATAALTPTLWFAGEYARQAPGAKPEAATVMLLIVIVGFQVAGAIVGRLDLEIRKSEFPEPTAWQSAVSTFSGAIIGIVALGISCFVVMVFVGPFL